MNQNHPGKEALSGDGERNRSMNEQKLHQSTEGKVLLIGFCMAAGLVGLIVFFWFHNPDHGKNLALAFLAHTFGGRAAGVGLCIMAGLPRLWNMAYNFYLEILIVCITYSLFVFSINHRIQFRWAITFTRNMWEKARKHKDKVQKYGWIGLFLFVMIPLPVTGPVVGSIIGYMLRMNIWRNMSAVFLGTLTAIAAWVLSFEFLEAHLHMIQYFLAVIVVIVLFVHIKTIKALFKRPPKN